MSLGNRFILIINYRNSTLQYVTECFLLGLGCIIYNLIKGYAMSQFRYLSKGVLVSATNHLCQLTTIFNNLFL